MQRSIFSLALIFCTVYLYAKSPPPLEPADVSHIFSEIRSNHASEKELSPEIMKRILIAYLEELDPAKTYLIYPEVQTWVEPSDTFITTVLSEYQDNDFSTFQAMFNTMVQAIYRRQRFDALLEPLPTSEKVSSKEFRDPAWAPNEMALQERLTRLLTLQTATATKLNPDQPPDTILKLIAKRRLQREQDLLTQDPVTQEHLILTYVLKASAGALDSQTAYFTPDEANQFMIQMQQRLFGIGAQLREDLDGLTVVRIIDGGPAAKGRELKAQDKIISVDGQPILGMEISDAVDLIRGPSGTYVTLTVLREENKEDTPPTTLEVKIRRGEVIVEEARITSAVEPYGDGVIGIITLYSFYQDPQHSSAIDLRNEIKKLQEEHHLKGVILDLRQNTGGLLGQAVEVVGLFITRGVVVSVKGPNGQIQHMRDLGGKMAWEGPLAILTSRGSASASEIVAQSLQDYGRALVIGDDRTFGKGSFQIFTLNPAPGAPLNPLGEYKVTQGRYYTVSGKSPQLIGVHADIVVPGMLSEEELGECFSDYPLPTDAIPAAFDDDLSDLSPTQRQHLGWRYRFHLQPRLTTYTQLIEQLRANSATRIQESKGYQTFLTTLKKDDLEPTDLVEIHLTDFQLAESLNVMRDLVYLLDMRPAS